MSDHAAPFAAGAPTFAALDLGTNNCRLLIAAPTHAGFRVIDSFSRVVGLGEGLMGSGRLSQAAMDRTLGALRVCAARIGRRRLRGLRAVATEACRRAENGRAFLDRVRGETGLAIDLISTREEAELALESCVSLLRPAILPDRPAQTRALLFDIGGGSTELAWIRLERDGVAPTLIGTESLALGVLTLSERFGPDGCDFEEMVAHVSSRLRAFETVHRIGREVAAGRVRLIGTSGTATTLASIALRHDRYRRHAVDGVTLSADAVRAATDTLLALGPDGLAAHPCVGPGRAALTVAGCAILTAIHQTWPADSLVVADRGLRDGMLLRMMRNRSPSPRSARYHDAQSPT